MSGSIRKKTYNSISEYEKYENIDMEYCSQCKRELLIKNFYIFENKKNGKCKAYARCKKHTVIKKKSAWQNIETGSRVIEEMEKML